jgi:hypothetical protein
MKLITRFILAAAPVVLIAACGGGDDSLDDRLGIADPKVRLVHAVPAAPNVSLYRNDVAQAADVTNLPYKGASKYFDVQTGNAQWSVKTATTPAATVGSASFNAERGHKFTLLAVPDAGSLTEVVLVDDPYNNKSVASDNARVRMFNASFNSTGFDVYLTAPGADINVAAPVFTAIGFKQAVPASGADSLLVEGGAYQLRLTTAGTKTVIFNSPVTLAKNADWLMTSVPGSLTANDVHVLVVKSDEGAAATELVNTP